MNIHEGDPRLQGLNVGQFASERAQEHLDMMVLMQRQHPGSRVQLVAREEGGVEIKVVDAIQRLTLEDAAETLGNQNNGETVLAPSKISTIKRPDIPMSKIKESHVERPDGTPWCNSRTKTGIPKGPGRYKK